MRTKNNWPGERKTILTKDDEETLSRKRLLGSLKSQDKQSQSSVCGLCSTLCVHSHVTKYWQLAINSQLLSSQIENNNDLLFPNFFSSHEVTLSRALKCQACTVCVLI